MKTKHRKASQHKRRWQKDFGVLQRVMNRLEPFTEEELARLFLPIRMSFDALRNGTGTKQDFLDVVAACNSASLRGADVDPLCQQTAVTGLEALRRMWERHKRIGQWGFDGPGLADVELAIELHEQLVRLSTPLELQQTMSRVIAARDAAELKS